MSESRSGAPMARKDRQLSARSKDPTKGPDGHLADLVVGGVATNALLVTSFAKPEFGELNLTEVFEALQSGVGAVNGGDLSAVEGLLSVQIVALNAMFGEMARRAALNMGQHIDAADRYMRLALRAQSQCRATAETLAVIKAGPPIFAHQANVAHGPQQVNNSATSPTTRARKSTESKQPELLESSDGKRLDTGTAGTASGGDSALEAVGAEHRPEDAGRQGAVAAQR
jgi:hypothetical protein